MSEFDDRLRELQEMTQKWKQDGFCPVEGEILVPPELEFAVSTLLKLRYRGVDQWKVYTIHRFNKEGVQVKTYVEGFDGVSSFKFTAEEAILIANAAAAKEFNKPNSEDDQD